MTIFKSGAPGVEWSPGDPDATVPLHPTDAESNQPDAYATYPSVCPACEGELGIDAYCLQCGQKAKSLREHFEATPAPWVGAVCDIGLTHARNEDALACLADDHRAVLVVCDGVTTSDDSDIASLAAARTACDLLWANDPQGTGLLSSRTAAVNALLTDAIRSANAAVVDQSSPTSTNSPASTIAIAVIDSEAVFCANLGDSRVYWIPDSGEPTQLTKDHSLAQDGIDSGALRADAESSVFAHTITKWLGRDAVDIDPYLASMPIESAGWIIVCSDGLWNYASEASAIKELITALEEPTPHTLATWLVTWANEQGGHDNITVACARVIVDQGPSPSEPETPLSDEQEPTQDPTTD